MIRKLSNRSTFVVHRNEWSVAVVVVLPRDLQNWGDNRYKILRVIHLSTITLLLTATCNSFIHQYRFYGLNGTMNVVELRKKDWATLLQTLPIHPIFVDFAEDNNGGFGSFTAYDGNGKPERYCECRVICK